MINVILKQDNITDQNKELISKIIKLLEVDEYQIINLRYQRHVNDNNFNLIFGESVYSTLDKNISKENCLSLPDLYKLQDKPEFYNVRLETQNKLLKFKDLIKIKKELKNELFIENLPNISIEDLLKIEKKLLQSDIKEIIIQDKNNMEIILSLDNSNKSINSISINELIAINLVKTVFNINSGKFLTFKKD